MSAAGAAPEPEAKRDAGKGRTLTSANWVLLSFVLPFPTSLRTSGPVPEAAAFSSR